MKPYKNNEYHEPDQVSDSYFDAEKLYTYADYLKFEIDEMVEIIRGRILRMSPAPRMKHQEICGNLFALLHSDLKGKSCKVYISPVDVVLPLENKKNKKSTTVVQPDICVICDPSIIKEKSVVGTPNFVVEIIAGNDVKRDTNIKYSVYEESGVGEYWIVFAEMRFVEVFILENGKYLRAGVYADDDDIPVATLPGVKVRIGEIFDGM